MPPGDPRSGHNVADPTDHHVTIDAAEVGALKDASKEAWGVESCQQGLQRCANCGFPGQDMGNVVYRQSGLCL